MKMMLECGWKEEGDMRLSANPLESRVLALLPFALSLFRSFALSLCRFVALSLCRFGGSTPRA